jgi:hypothetical protein
MKPISEREYWELREDGIPHVRQKQSGEYRRAATVKRTKRGFWMADV